MASLFNRFSVAAKLRWMAAVSAVALVAVAGNLLWRSYTDTMAGRQAGVRQVVEAAHAAVAWAHREEQAGRMTREQAQHLAKQVVGAIRYSGQEYLWINDLQARIVLHPIRPELNGTNGSTVKDPNGKAVFVAFADRVRQHKAGFVDYQWPKPGASAPVDKISYVSGFEPWGWVLGSGVYVDDVKAAFWQGAAWTLGGIALAILLMMGLARGVMRSILAGLNKAIQVAEAIARGDISQHLQARGNDEIGRLMVAMDGMIEKLRKTVGEMVNAADHMAQASAEIAAGNQDLSGRTEQAAASIEQTSASMSHLTDQVRDNAQAAVQAGDLATDAERVAAKGSEAMGKVVHTMGQIGDSSRKISDIIGVIDGIAFQTNILALNAAVEAARAGEQGRGFAVVAGEVRSLAQRSASAAKEIKTLIETSVHSAQTGVAMVQDAGSTMDQIQQAVQRLHGIVHRITASTTEQTSGIVEVNQAVGEMDRMTQQNAALVEQSAAAAHSLKGQSERLIELVQQFRLR